MASMPSPPATQQDLQTLESALRKEILDVKQEMQSTGQYLMMEMGRLHAVQAEHMIRMEKRMEDQMGKMEIHLGRDFAALLEQKFCDLRDSNNDKIALVHDRIDRLEAHIS